MQYHTKSVGCTEVTRNGRTCQRHQTNMLVVLLSVCVTRRGSLRVPQMDHGGEGRNISSLANYRSENSASACLKASSPLQERLTDFKPHLICHLHRKSDHAQAQWSFHWLGRMRAELHAKHGRKEDSVYAFASLMDFSCLLNRGQCKCQHKY